MGAASTFRLERRGGSPRSRRPSRPPYWSAAGGRTLRVVETGREWSPDDHPVLVVEEDVAERNAA
jgi:hypothetical protein